MRDEATGGRYRGLDLTSAMIMLNREFRTISRVIVHPQFRGLGLAVRLVRHALAESETIYVEALAAMGRVHPLFERAGMVRYERPVRPECARLIDALETLGIEPCLLADAQGVARRCAAMNEPSRRWIERELRHWYRKACMQRSHRQLRLRPDFDDLVRAAGNRLMSRPVYYLWRRGEPAPESAP
jgi:GNAT superfamily N-acetyltransferase